MKKMRVPDGRHDATLFAMCYELWPSDSEQFLVRTTLPSSSTSTPAPELSQNLTVAVALSLRTRGDGSLDCAGPCNRLFVWSLPSILGVFSATRRGRLGPVIVSVWSPLSTASPYALSSSFSRRTSALFPPGRECGDANVGQHQRHVTAKTNAEVVKLSARWTPLLHTDAPRTERTTTFCFVHSGRVG